MKRTLLLSLLLMAMMLFSGNMFAQLTVEIGDGTEVNGTTGAPSPYGTWYKAFRQQFLVLASELNDEGAGMGNINSIAFNVQVLNNITPMNNFRIRFKHTDQTTLTTTFETGTYTQVFQANDWTPTVGWNTHNFTTPFIWDGNSNLLVDIVTDVVTGAYAQNASTYYTTTPFSSSLRFQSDSASGDTATTGTVISNRSNMKLSMSALDLLDMAAISVEGLTTPSVNSEISYTVRVRNLSPDPVSNYSVKLLLGDNEIGSIPGTLLASMEFEEFEFDWTPTQTGPVTLYGKVVLPGDENPNNDLTPGLDVTVMEEGLTVVQIGDGTATNTETQPPAPYGTYWKNFRQQFLIRSNELYDQGASPGSISAMAFDVSHLNTCGPMPNYRIRLKHTNQNELTTTFETGDYIQVFQSPDFMPEVGWNLHAFQIPFFWDGASNLLVEIVTDIAPAVGRNASAFFTETGYNSAVRYQSDSTQADGYATGTIGTARSNMRFYINTEDTNDMAALGISGTQFPNVNSASDYVVRVMNISPDPVSNYTVKLMEVDGGVLGTAPGVLIDHLEVAEITIPWTPTQTGTMQIYGRVEMPGDENALNDNTFPMTVNVMEEGIGVFQIGEGVASNTYTAAPAPYGTYYQSFRQQFLVKSDEIYDSGGAPGNLSGIAFDVAGLNGITAMTNYRIRLKDTDQIELSTSFELGDYTQVFQANTFMPETGWNVHNFDVPYFWDGVSNLLVEIVTDLCGATGQNASATYTPPGFYSSLRAQSNTANSEFTATGTRSLNRSNMRFFLNQDDVVDMAAVSITGPYTPNVNSTVDYTIRVISSNSNIVSNYTVKLMDGDNVLASVAGTPIDYLETADFVLSWTPTVTGEYEIYGRVEMPGDEYEANNNTAPINVHVMEEGLAVVQIGEGTVVNTDTGTPVPYGTWFKNFRQQYLIRADEMYASGGAPGSITAIAFDVHNLNTCGPMPNYRIRLKHTDQDVLTTTFEVGDYTQVFHFDNFMPTVGWNLHAFQIPFFWDGASNLLVEIVTDIAPVVGRNVSAPYHTLSYNTSLRYQSDSIQADGNPTGTVSSNRNNMRIFINTEDSDDMAAMTISGPFTPNVNSTVDYTISVMNISPDPVSNYTVKLMEVGGGVLGTAPGVLIDHLESADIAVSWTPTQVGETQIYGRVEMPGDENSLNDNTAPMTVHVMEEGLTVVQIGDGTAINTATGAPAPYGTYFKNFRQQFLVKADELYDLGGAPGFINALSFDVSNINTCGPMPNYRIRLKDTNLTTFSTTFETGDYTQVFHDANFMPVNGWNVHSFSEPYFWDGVSNLIIEIVTDITATVGRNASSPYHVTSFNSALRYQSDSVTADGNPTGTVSVNRSNMRFFMDLGEIGSLRGTVTTSGFPMGDVDVIIEDTVWSQTTSSNGTYSFPIVFTGDYQVTAHKIGFEDLTLPVTIVEGEETILNFDMEASSSVLVSGRVTGSDNPTVGLDDTTVILVGPLTYEATTNPNGNFSLTVLSGNTYDYTIMRDGYDTTTGSINVGSTNYDMDTIIIEELTLPPGTVVAEVNATETAVDLVWSPPGTGGGDMFFDFENDDGDWEPSADWDAVGDWEYTNNYDVANFVPTYTGNNVLPPPSAYSGTGMWGTIINSNHTNAGGFNYLSKTFNLSRLTDATLRFMSWENLFGDWDYAQVSINGTLVWGPSWDYTNTQWQERIVDISAYDGMDEVTVRFEMFATTSVNYAGWYIDDVEIANAASFRAPTVNIPTADIRFAGLSEIEATNLVESETIRRPRDNRAQTATFTTAPGAQRIPVGYRVWRLTVGQEDDENSWTEITTTTVTDTTFSDTAWPTLPHTIYKWAVKTVYTNNVLSDPRFSNTVRLQPNDLSAIAIYGNTTPAQNAPVVHTVVVKNTGTSAQEAGSYTVKVMHGDIELASSTGPAIAVNEEIEVPLSWAPTETGPMIIHGLVVLPEDSEPDNDQSPPLNITIMPQGMFVIQLGDGTGVNTETGGPAPYGTYYKSFRQQFIYKSDEIYALGGASGHINAIAFNVQSLGTCSPMPNYRIRLKHTSQEALTTTFETGTYQQVFQAPSFMPEVGWNMHAFSEPFVWNGEDNILVDIVVDLFQSAYTRNAQTYYTAMPFNSSLRYQSDSIAGDTATTGSTAVNRSNTRFFMILDDMGHIEGIVRGEDGSPLPGVDVFLNVRAAATTNLDGEFFIHNLFTGDYEISFERYGYLTQSIDITIEVDETLEMDVTMEEMPQVSIIGTVVASDTGDGIADATLTFTGYADYSATTNAAGEFIVDSNVYAYNTYEYALTAAGYTAQTGSIDVGPEDYDMGVITMEELAFAPTQVEAVLNDAASTVNVSWNPPDPDAFEITESFEGVAFPPTDWTQTITNNGVPNMHGVRPTWCRFSVAEGVVPTDGDHQAGLTWIAEHQDEWLFTPGFTCPPDAYVRFDTHLEMGSEGGDHYYVKITTDNGANWQVLWDGAAQPSGLNSYDTPVVIDLAQYAGQMVKLAWHADDGVDAFGMWYNWYIDNVYIGNFVRTEQLSPLATFGSAISARDTKNAINTTRGINIDETNARLALKAPTAPNRALTGYKVWRLRSGHEGAENNWVLLTDEMLTETGYEDTGWSALAQGDYLWAVRAVYTSDVMSVPVFSNTVTKELTNGTISGFVRSTVGNEAIGGATVTAGDQFSATTTANGFYNISLPAGTYTITATHDEYTTVSHEDVVVVRDENTTLNFVMEPTSNEDVVEITVTALNSNYPNPFNPETTISYDIKDAAQVRLDVFNLKGQLVKTLVNDEQSAGRYNVVFTATDDRGNKLSSGLYFYRLRAGDYVKTRKMMLME